MRRKITRIEASPNPDSNPVIRVHYSLDRIDVHEAEWDGKTWWYLPSCCAPGGTNERIDVMKHFARGDEIVRELSMGLKELLEEQV